MEDILKQLYYGEIYPKESVYPSNTDYKAIQNKVSDEHKYFKKKMSFEDAERFDELKNKMYQISAMEGYENFAYGFKLGVALMLEVFY